jgi:hypothetical protein
MRRLWHGFWWVLILVWLALMITGTLPLPTGRAMVMGALVLIGRWLLLAA